MVARASARRGTLNATLAFAAAALVLAAGALDASLAGGSLADRAVSGASIDRALLTFHVPPRSLAAALDPLEFGLVVNGGEPAPPVLAVDDLEGNGTLSLLFLEGAGTEDAVRLVAPREGPFVIDVPVEVAPAEDALPSPRWGAPVASDGRFAYVFGGAVLTGAFAPDSYDAWTALRGVVRVDLATGAARTLGARLPQGVVAGAAFWDARETPACPRGCAFVLGGAPSPSESSSAIFRFDPVADDVERLPTGLPVPVLDPALVWTGEIAYLLGGGSSSVLAFDPISGEVADAGPSVPADIHAMSATFDPRGSIECPKGCGYLFGGKGAPDPAPPATSRAQERDLILRFDVATTRVFALPARLPVGVEAPSVAWDGERAIVLGGRACDLQLCYCYFR